MRSVIGRSEKSGHRVIGSSEPRCCSNADAEKLRAKEETQVNSTATLGCGSALSLTQSVNQSIILRYAQFSHAGRFHYALSADDG